MTQEFIKAFNEANETDFGKPAGGIKADLLHKFSLFRRNEDGSLMIFGLYMFICMMVISGMAVDTMRAEYQRTKVQATTDRALLASASMNQTLSAQEIFDDYFAKDGMPGMAPTATVDEGLNYRKVSADYAPDAIPTIKTSFMSEAFRSMMETPGNPEAGGINELKTFASGIAVDGVEKVEISLVLDVSGSMNRGSASGQTKLYDLKEAAREFVDTLMLNQPDDDTYSISIVPYSTQVNAGANLLSKYNASSEHSYSHCVDFDAADFNSTALSTVDSLQRTGHFHPWNNPYKNKDDNLTWNYRVCAPKAEREILPLSGDINELKNYVDNLVATGNTSTEIGIKWGVTLLDPAAQGVVTSLVSDGTIDAKFDGRPFSYTEVNALKVIVVMTDGANTNQYYLKPEVSSGMSNVWHMKQIDYRGRVSDRYAIYNENHWGSNKFFRTDRESTYGSWEATPTDGMTQMSYTELYDHASIRYVARYLMDPADYSYNYWRYGTYGTVGPNTKDFRMDNICTVAKEKDILIYTIGFEVTDSNALKLQNCASSAGNFFRVNGQEISEAFASIAAQLHRLRLEK